MLFWFPQHNNRRKFKGGGDEGTAEGGGSAPGTFSSDVGVGQSGFWLGISSIGIIIFLIKIFEVFFQLNSQYFILAIIDIEILEFYANHNFKSILASLHFVLLLLPLNEAEKNLTGEWFLIFFPRPVSWEFSDRNKNKLLICRKNYSYFRLPRKTI